MTVLADAQTIASRLSLTSPSVLTTSTSNNILLIRTLMERTAHELKNAIQWPQLQREYLFTLATSTASYALPGDFDKVINATLWNRTQHWPLIGPLGPQLWQNYKSGIIATLPRQRFRVKGITDNQFFIDPTPDSSINGQTMVYEYISSNMFRPKTWVASTSWLGLSYCFYNGNYYTRGGTGAATTGTTAPTHTSGSVSDGSITWTYLLNTTFDAIQNDSDVFTLDSKLLIDGTIWRFKLEKGLPYEELRAVAEEQVEIAKTKYSGASVLDASRRGHGVYMIDTNSYPIQDYGI